MSKKTLLKDINGRIDELNNIYVEANEKCHHNIASEVEMEIETLEYVIKMVDKHIK